jgi:predicted regulator of Ras-like GTPase activity (Roadblock/LC7/MglB family)
MTDKATALLQDMAQKLPSLVAAAAVHLADGLSIAELSTKPEVEASTASAYLAIIVQSNLQAIKILADGQVMDDILITTDQYYFLIRHTPGRPYFLFVMTEKDEWLGRARLIMREFNQSMEEILG